MAKLAVPAIQKTLFLVRHAKSSWKDVGLADRERPLSGRGKRDAPRMGALLARRFARPELLVTSPAVRAVQTAEAMAAALGRGPDDFLVDEGIYDAGPEELLEAIRRFDDRVRHAMLVGHNPALTALASRLAERDIGNLPTCGVLIFSLATDTWTRAGDCPATLLEFLFPKQPDSGN
jgi:phosphohistidine phosphatase